jgi:hypothetical protein
MQLAVISSLVRSSPRSSASIRRAEMSKPTTGCAYRANATATGRPTLPSPITAILAKSFCDMPPEGRPGRRGIKIVEVAWFHINS